MVGDSEGRFSPTNGTYMVSRSIKECDLHVFDLYKVSEKPNTERALKAPCLPWPQRSGNQDNLVRQPMLASG
jgi:hypothetical protein